MRDKAKVALLVARDEDAWRAVCEDFGAVPMFAWLSLPRYYRVALLARYVEEESVESVAARLGRSYKAAESVLARARRAFFERFRKDCKHWQ